MQTLLQDFRYGLRLLAKSPGFTAVAVLTLAFGIGANTAIFTLIDALLLRQLPVRQPGQLVQLTIKRLEGSVPFSYPMFRELEHGQRVFVDLIAWTSGMDSNVELNGTFSREAIVSVSGNYFPGLGTAPLLGRLISPDDANSRSGSTSQVCVLGYEFWQRRFGGSPDVLGKEIRIEGHSFAIIGVTRRWFTGMTPGQPPEIVVPLTAEPIINRQWLPTLEDRSKLWLNLTGRLKLGISVTRARAQLLSIWPGVLEATASTQDPGLRRQRFLSMTLQVEPAATGYAQELRSAYARPLYLLLGIAALILLVACVNLATLMLARAAGRTQEVSIRLALGANRWTVGRQVLTEALSLSLTGALLGLAVAYWGSHLLVSLTSRSWFDPIMFDLRPDWRVLSAASGAAILTGILFGFAPAWHASRRNPASLLQQNSRTLASGIGKLGKALIISQIALSFVLVTGAGLLVRTFQNLSSINLGFQQDNLLEVLLSPKPDGYQNVDVNAYRMQLIERLAAIPGVRSVAMGPFIPALDGWRDMVSGTSTSVVTARESGLMTDATEITPGFFATMGMRLLSGRDFESDDDNHHPRVAIVSRSLAEHLFPQGSAIGRRIRFGFMPEYRALEIVGVADDARLLHFRDAQKAASVLYLPLLQDTTPPQGGSLLVRTHEAAMAAAGSVTQVIESFGHEYAVRTETVSQVRSQVLVTEEGTAALSALFAGLALLLASIGLYGLMSYAVKRRTHEIGIRVALGAHRQSIRWMMLRQALALVALGTLIGIPCAIGAGRLVGSMLFGISSTDLATLLIAFLILLGIGLAAGYLPARRAMRVDPMVALRHE
jgi:predicted permease